MRWLYRQLRAWTTSRRRAERLLLEFLAQDQRRDYRRCGLFTVISQFGHRYQLGRARIIRRLEPDGCGGWRATACFCFEQAAGRDRIPDPDVILATALWLCCNEQNFLQTASAIVPQRRLFALEPFVMVRWF